MRGTDEHTDASGTQHIWTKTENMDLMEIPSIPKGAIRSFKLQTDQQMLDIQLGIRPDLPKHTICEYNPYVVLIGVVSFMVVF